MSAAKKFRDLPTGAVFVMDRGTETGLSNLSGVYRYVKIAPRRYREVGSGLAYLIGSVHVEVWQPCAQPGEYSPTDGLQVWLAEYDRLVEELQIFRGVDGADDINYPEKLRRSRDEAAARLAGYAKLVLANDPSWLS
jgi:hypothetical protein